MKTVEHRQQGPRSRPGCGALGSSPFREWLALQAMLLWAIAALFARSAVAQPAVSRLADLPLYFEASGGDHPTQFLARTRAAQFLIGPTDVQIALTRVQAAVDDNPLRRGVPIHRGAGSARLARLKFLGANAQAAIDGADPMPGKVNYLIGNDPAQWRTGLPTYGQVRVCGVYPGIDVVYYGNQHHLEYDFTIAPGADPAVIAFQLECVDKISLDAGELVLKVGDGEIRQRRPALYQLIDGVRREVNGGYKLVDSRTVSFSVGNYDRRLPLVIDPVFDYSTYFGGNGNDAALGIKVDKSGNIYIAGQTLSTQFPFTVPTNAFQRTFNGGSVNGDAFVAKLNSTGTQLLYFTYLGSPGEDGALDLAIDAAGNAYITGFTDSSGFPVRNAVFPTIHGTPDLNLGLYPNDVFVAELNTNGSALVFSTYFGGSGTEVGSAIAVDPAGYVYISGYSYSIDLPTSASSFQRFLIGTDDAFVAKFGPGGTNLVYATYLGGGATDEGEGIAADDQGCAYVTGYTISPGFPITTNAWNPIFNNNTNGFTDYDAFVTKLDPFGSNLIYSTFLGGTNGDFGYRITLDSQRNAYVTGASISPDFPSTGPVSGLAVGNNGTNTLNYDGFLTRLDASGRVVFSTLFGGTSTDAGWGVAVDPAGDVFVIGSTYSIDFPVVSPFGLFTTTNSGGKDVVVLAFSTNGTAVRYSGYLGGAADDSGYGIAVDAESSAYICGMTSSLNFPTTAAMQSVPRGGTEAFLAKIRLLDPNLTVALSGNAIVLRWPASAPQYVLQAAPGIVPPVTWSSVTQTPVLAGGFYTVTLGPTNNLSFFRLLRQ